MSDTARTTTDLSRRAWAELGLLSSIWGASFFAIEIALAELGPVTAVFFRVWPAAILLWLIALAQGLRPPKCLRIWGAFFVMGLLNNVLPFTLMSWGQTQIDTGLVSILNATTAIFGVLVASVVFADERLTPRRMLGVVLGTLGVIVAIGIQTLAELDPTSLAQYAVLAGAFSYALASAWARRMLGGLPPIVAAAGMVTGSTAIMLPFAIVTEGVPTLALESSTWTAIAYYSGLGTAGAYLLYYRVLGMAGAGNLMLCTLLIPPIAIFLGTVYLGERLAPTAYLGFALIALGLIAIDGRVFRLFRQPAPDPR